MASIETALITKERERASFDVEELTNILDGGKKATLTRRRVEHEVQSLPVIKETHDIYYMTKEQRLINGIKRSLAIQKYLISNDGDSTVDFPAVIGRALSKDVSLPIHMGVFIPTIQSLGSQEQADKWVPLSKEMQIIGTYAQTELGHGSFLRGLEMEAIYETSTKQFRINCPSLTAMKWWPGDMGVCANHVVLMAQLIINGARHGMHAFIVQIRDLDTHLPMPGVEVGVIGDKLGFESIDNGYLYLHNVKIPRENMLCRFTKVAEDGTYSITGNPMTLYGSMLLTRVNLLIPEAYIPLQMTCTIATRYSVVRRQGLINPGEPEVSVMEYQTQQGKILPQIAKAYTFNFAIRYVRKFYVEVKQKMEEGDYSLLPEVHALAAGMKSYITESALAGSEICRRACGGHGYLQSSGLPFLMVAQMASVIYEGENTVMYLQCARYLLKAKAQAASGRKLEGLTSYLSEQQQKTCSAKHVNDFINPKLLEVCFKHRAYRMITEAGEKVKQLIASGKSEVDAKNLTGIQLVKIAQAHIDLFVMSTFVRFLNPSHASDNVTVSSKLRPILTDLCCLHAIHTLNESSGDFLKDGFISTQQMHWLMEAEFQLLARLRPNAVTLVDAFDFTDITLRSALGSYDGNVYERLYQHAKNHPMNKEKVHKETYELLRPYLHLGRDKLKMKASL